MDRTLNKLTKMEKLSLESTLKPQKGGRDRSIEVAAQSRFATLATFASLRS